MHAQKLRVIISGGGTGGHIFPAISIANEIKKHHPDVDIRFVGALGRMEMEKVPAAGYPIQGLPIAGLQRELSLKNLSFPFKVIASLVKAFSIVKHFRPHIAIGVGGYASGPLLFAASLSGVPTLIQEQNSFAGITNKILGKRARKICVAYAGMETFFPKENIVITGNPIRSDIIGCNAFRGEALKHFGLEPEKKTVLVIGGSLGARTINQSMETAIELFEAKDLQVVWQTGKAYYDKAINKNSKQTKVHEFIKEMHLAFAAADIIVSRAGAGSISELCVVGKPVILVPSPNVAEDHQTHNAMALVNQKAALLIKDADALQQLPTSVLALLDDTMLQNELAENISKLAIPDSATRIYNEVLQIIASTRK